MMNRQRRRRALFWYRRISCQRRPPIRAPLRAISNLLTFGRIVFGRATMVQSSYGAFRERQATSLLSPQPRGASTPGRNTTIGSSTLQSRRRSQGGSIDVNGRGTLITTEECLLSDIQQRNPGVTRVQMERLFADYLGVKKVIWLERGAAGDDTHGHVDDITRFVAPRTIVTAYEPDRSDTNHEPLHDNFRRLIKSTDQSGNPLRVVKLPMPAPVYFRGQRLPASYANFYIANKLVLVPVFSDPNDRVALNTLAEVFPGREIVGIYCRDFIWGLGALHCMTQQQPAE